ncbi:hypothetical protein [Bacillus cereus group sp. TH152-1LC]|uniref:hypothetical protein n=1 Tax=Bacillus cereus group sp. TH152-1LC TaxID=3018060 RepID=UPI0022E53143|nr:hypothetical protein [Bacillus cereus group sp. TH152-1LC]MDA1675740.1 hypothetical protein [Bacillus cereus group sp. TH152-1LC]
MTEIQKDFQSLMEELHKKYEVPNLIGDSSEIIFILESPHIEELFYDAPISGLSGGTMTKALFGQENKIPLGRVVKDFLIQNNDALVSESKELDHLNKIGIMNICRIPMQKAAYIHSKTIEKYGIFNSEKFDGIIELIEQIRKNNKDFYKDESKNILQKIILDRFSASLRELKDKKLYLVPCGKTAEKFFKLSGVSNPNWTIVEGIPHPSYNSWAREKYCVEIQNLKGLMKK